MLAIPAKGQPGRAAALSAVSILSLAIVGLCAFPLYWLFILATQTTRQFFSSPPALLPGANLPANWDSVLQQTDILQAGLNSLVVTVAHVGLSILLSSMVGFTFAHYRFRYRNIAFALVLVTLIVPTGVLLVPQFQIYQQLGWAGTYWPLIIPGAASAFGVFWFRQYAEMTIPYEIVEASKIDGCGLFRTYWALGLPMLKPACAAFGVFTAIWTWNDYLWPLIIINDPARFTLPVALAQLSNPQGFTDYPSIMAGTALSVLPMLAVLVFARRHITASIAGGALKG